MFYAEDRRKWNALFRRSGAQGDSEMIFAMLKRKYKEPHRAYHTAAHIRHCLVEFRQVRDMPRNPNAVELALWFHDAVYAPFRKDNEHRSARFAEEVLFQIGGVSDDIIARVTTLIMATQHNVPLSPHDPDAIMMADIDLSPLGVHPQLFDENSQRIRREFKMGDNKKSLEKQAWFLVKLLRKKQNIYGTDYFYEKYEKQARRNIERLAVRAGVM